MASVPIFLDPLTGKLSAVPTGTNVPIDAQTPMSAFQSTVPNPLSNAPKLPVPPALSIPDPTGQVNMVAPGAGTAQVLPPDLAAAQAQPPNVLQALGPEAAPRVPPQPAPIIPSAPQPPQATTGQLATQQSPLASGPPKTPEERATRTTNWEKFLTKLTEPGVSSALLQFGLAALQPVQPGQTTAGHLAGAASGALQSFAAGKALQKKDAADAAKLKLLGRQVGAQEATAQAAKTRAGASVISAKAAATAAKGTAGQKAEELKIKQRLADSTVALNKAREKAAGLSKQSANKVFANAIAQSLLATGQEKDKNQAFLRAVQIMKTSTSKADFVSKTLSGAIAKEGSFILKKDKKTGLSELDKLRPAVEKVAEEFFGTGGEAASGAKTFPPVTAAAVEKLKANPDRKAEFDALFGPGAADRVLGGQ